MLTNYRIVLVITFLLTALSISLSVANYTISLQLTQTNLRTRALPLTVDNIYTEIQKHLIEPNLIASMMAHDTFLKDWLINKEEDVTKISHYLEAIKNKYSMFTTFLVSEKTQHYYTEKGFVEKIDKNNAQTLWYLEFKDIQAHNEINLDFNKYIDNSMITFINHKIFDEDYHMIGATGVGLKMSYVDDMLKKFRTKYHFNVFFIDKDGQVILHERGIKEIKHLDERPELFTLKNDILSPQSNLFEYLKDNERYLLETKYIPELRLYLLVEAKVSHFTKELKNTFYFNLLVSLSLSAVVGLIILFMVKKYNYKLEHLARHDSLTGLQNRGAFNERFEHLLLAQSRKEEHVVLLFFDIDDFKHVNDTYGHDTGDEVLKRIAEVLRQEVRQTDHLTRWGGEEFIITLIDSSLEDAKVITEKLRLSIEHDKILQKLVHASVTASFGLTKVKKEDNMHEVMKRVDKALYEAKSKGKNTIVVV